jgi:alpha-tubulin suppressor-like RCC1 family protein
MANVKISALPAATSALVTDEFPINQGGTTKKLTLDQIKSVVGGGGGGSGSTGGGTNTLTVVVSGFDPNTAECDSTLVWDCNLKRFVATKQPKFDAPPASTAIKFLGKPKAPPYTVMAVTTENRVVYWGNDEGVIGGRSRPSTAGSPTNVAPNNYVRMKFINNNGLNPTHEDYMVLNPTLEVLDLHYGRYGAMALLSDGTVWINGYGPYIKTFLQISQTHNLVSNYTQGYFLKVNLPSGVKVTKIYYGADNDNNINSYICITDTKDVYVFGDNYHGCCGVGVSHTTRVSPTLVTNSQIAGKALDIFTGFSQYGVSLILTEDGKLFGAGYNGYGQLGQGNTTSQTSFVQIDTNVKYFAKNNMWLTRYTIMYIKNDGTIWGTGYTGYYQLGNPTTQATTPRQVTQTTLGNFVKIVTCSPDTATIMAMTNTGKVYTWGVNTHGAVGNGNTTHQQTPYEVTGIVADDIFASQNYGNGNCLLIKAKNNMLYAAGYRSFTTSFAAANTLTQSVFMPYSIHLTKDKIRDIGVIGFDSHYGTFLTTTDGHLFYCGYAAHSQGSIIGDSITEFSYVM